MNRFALGSGRIHVATILSIALTLFAGAQAKSADITILGNYSTPLTNPTSSGVGYLDSVQTDLFQGQGFTVGATSWQMTTVDVALEQFSGTATPVMQLYSATGGLLPNSAIATATGPVPSPITARGWYRFTLPYNLVAGTSYFIVLSDANGPAGNGYDWHAVNGFVNPSPQNGSGLTYLSSYFSQGGSGPWTVSLNSMGIQINAVPVPEPSTYALGAIGVLTLGIVSKRRKRATA